MSEEIHEGEVTQIHYDCADIAANWLLKLCGDDVRKAFELLELLEKDKSSTFGGCVDLILAAISDGRGLNRPSTFTVCEMIEHIEKGKRKGRIHKLMFWRRWRKSDPIKDIICS